MEVNRVSALATWTAPQCPFKVEYSARALDDIRLSVVDAFYSLPRGGVEIGGLLLGRYVNGSLRITAHEPIECEHATGPSFTLSERDQARLALQLEEARGTPAGRQPVGWYHSHTRSEVFLSPADQEIHRRYFPEPWQVALVLRPYTLQPTRAGFFFTEPDGSIHGEASYTEFALTPLGAQRPPAGEAPATRPPQPDLRKRRSGPAKPEIAGAGKEPVASTHADFSPAGLGRAPVSEPGPQQQKAIPAFLETAPARSRRRVWPLLSAAVVLASVATAFQTRDYWVPRAAALVGAKPAPVAPNLGLSALDLAGQLQIRWRQESVSDAVGGRLEIIDRPRAEAIPLDPAHLRAGVFTYERTGARVDITLVVRLRDGRQFREATSFLGAAPPPLRSERDALTRQATDLQSDLDAQRDRARSLEQSLQEARTQLKDERRRRLVDQDPSK